MLRSSSMTPIALQYLYPPLDPRMILEILLAISRSSVSRLILKATSGIRTPTAVTLQLGESCVHRSPGFQSSSNNFSGIPSNCPYALWPSSSVLGELQHLHKGRLEYQRRTKTT